jgi:hypothetical protein
MIDDECGAIGGMIGRGNRSTRRKHAHSRFVRHKFHMIWTGLEPGPFYLLSKLLACYLSWIIYFFSTNTGLAIRSYIFLFHFRPGAWINVILGTLILYTRPQCSLTCLQFAVSLFLHFASSRLSPSSDIRKVICTVHILLLSLPSKIVSSRRYCEKRVMWKGPGHQLEP